MSSLRRAFSRIGAIFRSHSAAEADLRAEMQAHLELEIDEYIRRGMDPAEARRRAMIASGGLTQAAEKVHELRGLPWFESLAADARFALRHFRRTPMSTITMVLVLSLGIGTNVVLFTVLHSLATMPAPGIARDASLVRIRGTVRSQGATDARTRLMSWPEVQEYTANTDVFSSVAAYAEETAVVNTNAESSTPLTVNLIYTTSSYFSLLGIHPSLGTTPAAEPGIMRMTTSPTAVISYAMWQQRFGGALDVLGRTLRVNDFPVEIVGVAPQRFNGTEGSDRMTMWIPLAAYPLIQKRTTAVFISYDSTFLSAAAQLRADVTAKTATPIVAGVAQRAFQATQLGVISRNTSTRGDGGSVNGGVAPTTGEIARETGSADVVPLLASNHSVSARKDLLVSGAASGGFALLVLLITCTNVSALLVGLAVARRREIGVRLSLGAPRTRLIRQLLTESVLLAMIAATVGLIVTAVGIRLIGTALNDVQLVVDWPITIATCAIAIVTGVLFGLSPALHATRVSVGDVLKSSATSVAATRSRLQRALVIAQITLTQPLLVGLGVVIVTMLADINSRVTSVRADQIVEIELDTWAGRVTNEERSARIAAVVERVAAMPGIVAAMPMQMGTITVPLTVHPADRIAGVTNAAVMQTRLTAAPKGYFGAFHIPFVRGRDFDAGEYTHLSDDPMRPPVYDRVIIGGDLARRLWGTANPIGRRLTIATATQSPALVVVGVVDEAAAGPSDVNGEMRAYVSYSAMNTGVIAQTAGPALPMLNSMRSVVAAEAPQMRIARAQTMEQRESESHSKMLRASGAFAAGGLLALLLSAIGLYAVVSFTVGQRTREIGIRTALGAPGGQVVRMFFVKGLALSGIGLVLGLPLSMIATRFIGATLNWPMTSSPLLGVAIGGVVLMVASVAVWIPARRASGIDPVVALRVE